MTEQEKNRVMTLYHSFLMDNKEECKYVHKSFQEMVERSMIEAEIAYKVFEKRIKVMEDNNKI